MKENLLISDYTDVFVNFHSGTVPDYCHDCASNGFISVEYVEGLK